ncbi:MAG: hypothetical protein ACXU8A_00085 [Burkholderiaceae bacterium]
MIHIRASMISDLMTDGKRPDGLGVGAITALNAMAKEYVYGFNEVINTKYFNKGIQCEDDAIELYNNVFFANLVKNKERKTNDWLTGECDIIIPGKKIIDIKCAWSLPTFPATTDEVVAIAKKSGYDYQGHAYMHLWDVDEFEVAYCMVSTPEDLRRYEQVELHEVDHIDPALRVTRCTIKRDKSLEEKMKAKVLVAREYLLRQVELIKTEHLEAA